MESIKLYWGERQTALCLSLKMYDVIYKIENYISLTVMSNVGVVLPLLLIFRGSVGYDDSYPFYSFSQVF